MSQPELRAIYLKRAHRGPMDAVPRASMRAQAGLEGNVEQRSRRQITLVEEERWEHFMQTLGGQHPASARRANLVVRGIDLSAGHGGRLLRIGAYRIRILGETKPCERMEALLPGLEQAMYPRWGGGAFGVAVDDGDIRVGDPVAWDGPDAGDGIPADTMR